MYLVLYCPFSSAGVLVRCCCCCLQQQDSTWLSQIPLVTVIRGNLSSVPQTGFHNPAICLCVWTNCCWLWQPLLPTVGFNESKWNHHAGGCPAESVFQQTSLFLVDKASGFTAVTLEYVIYFLLGYKRCNLKLLQNHITARILCCLTVSCKQGHDSRMQFHWPVVCCGVLMFFFFRFDHQFINLFACTLNVVIFYPGLRCLRCIFLRILLRKVL